MQPIGRSPEHARPEAGFTIIEVFLGITILTFAAIALGGVLIATNESAYQDAARIFMLQQVQEHMEEIRGTAPDLILDTYDGQTYAVNPDYSNGDVAIESASIVVSVDDSAVSFLDINLTANWNAGNVPGTLTLTTGMYIP